MENISRMFCAKRVYTGRDCKEECELQTAWEIGNDPVSIEKEMGIRRRKRRSLHGRDIHGKIPYTTCNGLSPTNTYASCLEINEESVVDTVMEGCTNVEDMVKKLKEQTISLTKKRCIKSRLKPVDQSKLLKLSPFKKLKYQVHISFNKLQIGFRNFLYTFELWYSSLKMIEGKFGSSVTTYFKFLRKLFILNCIIFILNFFFVILPQVLYVQFPVSYNASDLSSNSSATLVETNKSYEGKMKPVKRMIDGMDEESDFFFFLSYTSNTYEENNNMRLGNLFTGMGYLSDSVLFYGHYMNSSFSLTNGYAYDIPSAYFFSTAFCYFLVLCVLFFSVAGSYEKCYIETSNGVHNVFAEKIFCGWDFGIAKPDAEELKYSSISMELKELLNESNREKKSGNIFHTLVIRISLNLMLLLLLAALGWYTSTYLDIHMDSADIPTIMMLMLMLTLVTSLAPVCLSLIARVEDYDGPRTALYATLVRTFIIYTLIIIVMVVHRLNSASKITCWETVVGQDFYRLVVLDFIVGVGDNMIEFIRSRLNKRWKQFDRPEFNIARNTMNLIYNQGLLYVGLYFSPGLSLIVAFKMLITFYLKKWGAMYNCRPSKTPWRAAQMQTVFLSFAFLVFFFVIIAYGYIFTSVKTSSCGPFGGGKFMFDAILYEVLHDGVNSTTLALLLHFLRSGVAVVVFLIMILAIYYLRSVNSVRRRIVENLRNIIKEQVAHKKKLLMKIQKAEEVFKNNAVKRSGGDRSGKRYFRFGSASALPNRLDEDSSSDAGDQESAPLRRKSKQFRNSNLIKRLSKSNYNLDEICRSSLGSESGLSRSLQNVFKRCEDIGDDSESIRLTCKDERTVTVRHRNETLEKSSAKREESRLMQTSTAGESVTINNRSFNYDDRIPSRIYFGRQ